jgi:hypothetical protein
MAGTIRSAFERAKRGVAGPFREDVPRLLALSFLMLFVELSLIRWTGSYVVYLSYFTNLILLASFLGIGVGFLRAGARRNLFPYTPIALGAFTGLVLLLRVEVRTAPGEATFTGIFGGAAPPAWIVLPLIYVAAFAVMAMIAEGVAQTFVRLPPLRAYQLDLVGSIGGVIAFSILSFAGAPPLVWAIVTTVLLVALLPTVGPLRAIALLAFVGILAIQSLVGGDRWSPYYRITASPERSGVTNLRVNGIPHQSAALVDRLRTEEPLYFRAYRRSEIPTADDVLIVGSGLGNDVAVALSQGAERVDAVEIDPTIAAIGRDVHPDRPYADPRVRLHVGDARSFVHETRRRYDLILYGLAGSLAIVPGQSALRLESYLYTTEAIRDAMQHLRPAGVLAMYNYYRRDVLDRLGRTIEVASGAPPCLEVGGTRRGRREAVLTTRTPPGVLPCSSVWQPQAGARPEVLTDDRPFPYLGRGIPTFYVVALAILLLGSTLLIRLASGPLGRSSAHADLFFMGAAFLLLETKNVVQFALLFGTTWFVNALVFVGILLVVLAAVEVADRIELRPRHLYAALFGSLALAWAVPATSLLGLGAVPRFIVATVLAFTPVFLANLVFAQRFKQVRTSAHAFGSNLLGAMVGGVLEYSSLLIGYRALIPLIGALYALSFVVRPRARAADSRRTGRVPVSWASQRRRP